MAMKKTRFILILLGLFVWNGCYDEKSPHPSYNIEATIECYLDINRSNFYEFTSRNVIVANIDNGVINLDLFISGTNIIATLIDFALGEGTAEQYAELREEFGDFNPNFCSVYSPPPRYIGTDDPCYQVAGPYCYQCAFGEKICALTVTSSADWDAEHPAGTSLNGLFDIDFYSVYPYIKRGFTGDVLTYQQKPLSELAEDDLWLCACDKELHISTTSLPATRGTHTIFVTLTLDTGEQIEYSTDYTFE